MIHKPTFPSFRSGSCSNFSIVHKSSCLRSLTRPHTVVYSFNIIHFRFGRHSISFGNGPRSKNYPVGILAHTRYGRREHRSHLRCRLRGNNLHPMSQTKNKARRKLTRCTSLVVLHRQTNSGQSHFSLPENLSGRQRRRVRNHMATVLSQQQRIFIPQCRQARTEGEEAERDERRTSGCHDPARSSDRALRRH